MIFAKIIKGLCKLSPEKIFPNFLEKALTFENSCGIIDLKLREIFRVLKKNLRKF